MVDYLKSTEEFSKALLKLVFEILKTKHLIKRWEREILH